MSGTNNTEATIPSNVSNPFEINKMTQESLQSMEAQEVISLVLVLKEENDKLKIHLNPIAVNKYEERLVKIEREINLCQQYSRRDTIEIAGIPSDTHDDYVEDECLKILKAASVKVGTKNPVKMDIQAAHWKKNKKSVIVKFVNRKFAASAITNRSNLKDKDIYGDNTRLFINQSLCPEFAFINFVARKAKKDQLINFYKMKNGVTLVQKNAYGSFVACSHINDLVDLGLDIPSRSN